MKKTDLINLVLMALWLKVKRLVWALCCLALILFAFWPYL